MARPKLPRCTIAGCNTKLYAKGVCLHHYNVSRRALNAEYQVKRRKRLKLHNSCVQLEDGLWKALTLAREITGKSFHDFVTEGLEIAIRREMRNAAVSTWKTPAKAV